MSWTQGEVPHLVTDFTVTPNDPIGENAVLAVWCSTQKLPHKLFGMLKWAPALFRAITLLFR